MIGKPVAELEKAVTEQNFILEWCDPTGYRARQLEPLGPNERLMRLYKEKRIGYFFGTAQVFYYVVIRKESEGEIVSRFVRAVDIDSL